MKVNRFHKIAETPQHLVAKEHKRTLPGYFLSICDLIIRLISKFIFCCFLLILPFFVFYYGFPYSEEKANKMIQASIIQKPSSVNPIDKRFFIVDFEHDDLSKHSLPEHLEINDSEFIEILYKMEGDDSFLTYTRGLIKGGLTIFGLQKLGGGSTTLISTAGDILGHRHATNISKVDLFINRLREIRLAGAINKMDSERKHQLIAAHLPQYNNVTGASLTSLALFGHLPTTTQERFILATTVHKPATIGKSPELHTYAQNWCNSPRLSEYNIDCSLIVKNSFIPKYDPLSLSKSMRTSGYKLSSLSESNINAIQRVNDEIKNLSNIFPESIVEVNLAFQQVLPDKTLADMVLIQRASSNEQVRLSGFDNDHSIASVAKLIGLLANEPLAMSSIQAYAMSDNNTVESNLRAAGVNDSQLRSILNDMKISYHNDSNSLVYGLSQGNIQMSSNDVLRLLSRVSEISLITNSFANRQSASSAIQANYTGTLRVLSNDLEYYNVIVAKSGTDSTRQTPSSRPLGVHGKLVALSIQKDEHIFHILIRIHSANPNDNPICRSDGCISINQIRPTITAILQLIESLGKKSLDQHQPSFKHSNLNFIGYE